MLPNINSGLPYSTMLFFLRFSEAAGRLHSQFPQNEGIVQVLDNVEQLAERLINFPQVTLNSKFDDYVSFFGRGSAGQGLVRKENVQRFK